MKDDPVFYFDGIARSYASWTGSGVNFKERSTLYARLIRTCARSAPTQLCLDLGCGNGELTAVASDAGFESVGIDGSAEMLALASATHSHRVSFRQERLPLPRSVVQEFCSRVGLILASSVIEHLDRDAEFLTQCRAMLAPGGHALISFPNARSSSRRMERLLGPRGPFRGTIVEVQRRHYDPKDVIGLADAANLFVEGVHFFGLPYARVLNRVTARRPPWLATLLLAHLRRERALLGT